VTPPGSNPRSNPRSNPKASRRHTNPTQPAVPCARSGLATGRYNAAGLSLWTCEDDIDSDCVGAPDDAGAAGAAGGAALAEATLEGAACCKRGYVQPIFYLLSCAYLYLSALQLQRGMPLVVRDHPLTDSNDQLSYLVFKGLL
jgi:hypothetical protein